AKRDPDIETRLTVNEAWWGWGVSDPKTNVSEIVYRPIANPATRVAALLSGELDFVLDPPLQDLARIKATPGLKVEQVNQIRTIFFGVDTGVDKLRHTEVAGGNPFKNPKVREAMYRAIDIDTIRKKTMRGMSFPAGIITSPGVHGYTEALDERLGYDVDAAKKLLAEAGYPNGLEFEAFTSQREDYRSMMLLVQEMLRKANINMKLNIIDHTTFHNDRKQDKGLLMPYSKSHAPVPSQALFGQFASSEISRSDGSGGENHSHYGEDGNGIDDILDMVSKEADLAKRNELTRKAELKILDDMPAFTLTTQSLITVLGPRVDLGFEVEAGYPQYVLNKARLKG
ncbi:MAG: ABC transporter substrate-binding protein, partial [Rhodospirillales bacterium]